MRPAEISHILRRRLGASPDAHAGSRVEDLTGLPADVRAPRVASRQASAADRRALAVSDDAKENADTERRKVTT